MFKNGTLQCNESQFFPYPDLVRVQVPLVGAAEVGGSARRISLHRPGDNTIKLFMSVIYGIS
jgi:hypothetical protein